MKENFQANIRSPGQGAMHAIPPPSSTYLTRSYVSWSPLPPLHPAGTWGTGQLQSGHSPRQGLALPMQTLWALPQPQAHRALPSSPDFHLSSQRWWPCVRGMWTPTATPRAEAGRSPISHISGYSGEGWCGSKTLTFHFKGSQKQ